jgi:hypothetical protein
VFHLTACPVDAIICTQENHYKAHQSGNALLKVHEQAKEPQYKAATKTGVWDAPQAIGDNIHVKEV